LEHPRNPTTYSIHHGSDTYHEIIVPIPNHYLYSDVSLRNNNTDELHRASNIISTIQHMQVKRLSGLLTITSMAVTPKTEDFWPHHKKPVFKYVGVISGN
jgi:hypothetical protein